MYRRGAPVEAAGHDDDGVVHRPVLLQPRDQAGHGGGLLADGDVDADHVLALLVDDGVQGDGRLAGAPVADDELALPAPDGDHGVDGLDPGLQRLLDGLPADDAGGFELHLPEVLGLDGALVVQRHAQRIHHPPDEGFADRDLDDVAGPLDDIALFDEGVFPHEHGADAVFLQVEHQADDVVGQLEHLRGHRVLEPLDTRDAVAHLDHGAHFLEIHPRLVLLDTRLKDAGYLLRTQLQLNPPC